MKNSIKNLIATLMIVLFATATTFAQEQPEEPIDSSDIVGTMIINQERQQNNPAETFEEAYQRQELQALYEYYYLRNPKAIYRGSGQK